MVRFRVTVTVRVGVGARVRELLTSYQWIFCITGVLSGLRGRFVRSVLCPEVICHPTVVELLLICVLLTFFTVFVPY